MHTFEGKNGTLFFHNGDLSGDVLISRKHLVVEDEKLVVIDAKDLVEFVSEMAIKPRIQKLVDKYFL